MVEQLQVMPPSMTASEQRAFDMGITITAPMIAQRQESTSVQSRPPSHRVTASSLGRLKVSPSHPTLGIYLRKELHLFRSQTGDIVNTYLQSILWYMQYLHSSDTQCLVKAPFVGTYLPRYA